MSLRSSVVWGSVVSFSYYCLDKTTSGSIVQGFHFLVSFCSCCMHANEALVSYREKLHMLLDQCYLWVVKAKPDPAVPLGQEIMLA